MRKSLALIVIAILAGALVGFWASRRPLEVRRVNPTDVVRLRIQAPYSEPHDQPLSVVSDRNAIARLLLVIRDGQTTPKHKCGPVLQLAFDLADGRSVGAGILPGHNAGFYEFASRGHFYRVERERFLAAMEGVGVDRKEIVAASELTPAGKP